jgi:hypothetical protein
VQRELAERIYKVRLDVETIYMVLRQPPCAPPVQSL